MGSFPASRGYRGPRRRRGARWEGRPRSFPASIADSRGSTRPRLWISTWFRGSNRCLLSIERIRFAPHRRSRGYSLMEFMREFPDDEACLQWLWRAPRVDDGQATRSARSASVDRPFHRVKDRPAWDCDYCGYHLHPTAGTIFHKSSTSLHLWFYAMYLMTRTRCGISAKQLERELGVTYKTAWRMLNLIRNQLMDEDDDAPLRRRGRDRRDRQRRKAPVGQAPESRGARAARPYAKPKTTVFGMVERGGRVRAMRRARSRNPDTCSGAISEHVLPASMIFTDEWRRLDGLARRSRAIAGSATRRAVYVDGDVHTKTIEGFFGLVKTGSAASTTPSPRSGSRAT